LTKQQQADLAASLQAAIVDSLLFKLKQAAKKYRPASLQITGGVSANIHLRAEAEKLAKKLQLPVFFPKKLVYCTDNAAMIAAAAQVLFQQKTDWDWRQVNLNLERNITHQNFAVA